MSFIINPYNYSGVSYFDITNYSGDTPLMAYSLRNLSSTYSGNIIKLRRSSDNATSDFTATHGNFVDFTAITSWRDAAGAATAYVDTWYDQSGNSYNLTQSSLTEQPEFRYTAQPFGTVSAAIKFDGSNDTLYYDATTDDFCNNQATIYNCYHPVGTVFSSMWAVLAAPGSPVTTFARSNRYSTQKRTYWNNIQATATIGSSGSNEHCIDYWDGTNLGYNIDNGTYTNTAATAAANNEQVFLIGGSATGGSNPFNGWFVELLWFDTYQASGTQDEIRDDQNSFYTLF
jgi:hypothetical protein